MANYYQILELPNFASLDVVRKSFRKLALQYHPDKHGGNPIYENKFKEINTAYQTLGDPQKKTLYDQRLLYGYSTTSSTTQQSNRSTASQNPNPSENKRKEAKSYKQKKRKVLKPSIFQKAFIKFAYAMFGVLFILIIATWILEKKHNGKQALRLARDTHLNKISYTLEIEDLNLTESLIDSIDLFSSYISDKEVFSNELNIKYRTLASNYDKKNDYKNALSMWKESLRIQKKYNLILDLEKVKVIILEHLFLMNEVNKAFSFFNSEISGKISNLNTRFLLTDLLLKYNHLDAAYAQLKSNAQWIFNGLNTEYGRAYYFTVQPGNVSELRLQELAQFYCLHRIYETRDQYSSLSNFLIRNSQEEELSSLIKDLKAIDFNFESLSTSKNKEEFINRLAKYHLQFLVSYQKG